MGLRPWVSAENQKSGALRGCHLLLSRVAPSPLFPRNYLFIRGSHSCTERKYYRIALLLRTVMKMELFKRGIPRKILSGIVTAT